MNANGELGQDIGVLKVNFTSPFGDIKLYIPSHGGVSRGIRANGRIARNIGKPSRILSTNDYALRDFSLYFTGR